VALGGVLGVVVLGVLGVVQVSETGISEFGLVSGAVRGGRVWLGPSLTDTVVGFRDEGDAFRVSGCAVREGSAPGDCA
jgi:hypothetical protein